MKGLTENPQLNRSDMYRMYGIRAMQRDAAYRSDGSARCGVPIRRIGAMRRSDPTLRARRVDFLFSDRLLVQPTGLSHHYRGMIR